MIDLNCGIYEIRNLINGKVYIGSSCNLKGRMKEHFRRLRKGIHHSKVLQRSFNKYGEEAFKFSVLCICSKDTLLRNEQAIMNACDSSNRTSGYNIAKVAGCPSVPCTDEVRKQRSVAYRNKSEKYLFRGRMMPLRDIADEVGMNGNTLYNRVKLIGMSLEDALTTKVKRYKFQFIEIGEESKTAKEWCNQYGINLNTFNQRLASGMTTIQALTTPIKQTERLLTIGDKTMNVNAWARETSICASLIIARIDRLGWSIEEAISIQVGEKRERNLTCQS